MLETVESGRALSKTQFKAREARLRVELLAAQRDLAADDKRLIVVLGGVEASGRSEFANLFLSWVDARGVQTHALGDLTAEERQRPYFWRFWSRLPPTGHAGVFLRSWYNDAIDERVFRRSSGAELSERLERVVEFERMLVEEGTILVKLWFHIAKKEQARRLKALEKDKQTRWRVTDEDWKRHAKYGRYRKVCEETLSKTSTGEAPWQLVDAGDRRLRDATAAGLILEAIRRGLSPGARPAASKPDHPRPRPGNVLRRLDMSLSLSDAEASKRLSEAQNRLGYLARRLGKKERALILAFEGPDAAGKGGVIRRITRALDASLYEVHPVSAPSDEERARPYLWRFWRALPRLGRVSIYDRTWYGRVLVERIEGFAAPAEWRRAYNEIDEFESQLVDSGIVLLKFWLEISPEEQLRRFKDRQLTPYKQFKLTAEDWRNREKWDAYEAAACEMIERTSTAKAPWVLVEAEDKRWARVKVLETIVETLEREL